MKRLFRQVLQVLAPLMLYVPLVVSGQDVTGIWRGYFITEQGEYYKLEFQVQQNPTLAVSGVSYSYLDVRFYGKATMTGSFSKSSNVFKIKEVRTVEVKSSTGGGTCIMNYNLEYSRSGKEEFLEGTYLGRTEVRGEENPYEWGQCGRGKVFLRKVTTTEFYVEPFLRKNRPSVPPVRRDSTGENAKPPVAKVNPPAPKKPTPPPPATKPRQQAPVARQTPPRPKPPVVKLDSPAIRKVEIPTVTNTERPVVTGPSVLTTRTNELMKSLTVNSPEVTVRLYDNGEVDDDTISIYFDRKLLMSNKRLSTAPITLKLKLEDQEVPHELVMVAENLGRIPPNTSLMIVDAGTQRFEVRITSNEQKNALVRFRYEPPASTAGN